MMIVQRLHSHHCSMQSLSGFQILQMLEEEEERLWQEQREAAYKMADEARKKFRQHFEVSAPFDTKASSAFLS